MQVAYTASLLVQTNGGTPGRYDCALGQCALTLPLASRNQTAWGQPLLTAYGFASVPPSGDLIHEITGPTRQFTVQQLPQQWPPTSRGYAAQKTRAQRHIVEVPLRVHSTTLRFW